MEWMTYLVHLLSPSYWVRTRSGHPALATAEKSAAGNLRQLMKEKVGLYDVKLQDMYGMVARLEAPFGARRFLLLIERRSSLTLN